MDDKIKILVIGDVILDEYWLGDFTRISPEAPVPIVKVDSIKYLPGGAGNVANNLISLGVPVSLFGLIGTDEKGEILENYLFKKGIDVNLLKTDFQTINKIRIVSKSQQMIRLDFEKKFKREFAKKINNKITKLITNFNLVILSDYNKGSLLPQEIINICNKNNVPTIIDPKGSDFKKYTGASYLTPNISELECIVGKIKNENSLISHSLKIVEKYQLKGILVTRSEKGVTLIEKSGLNITYSATSKEVMDVTGAGDTFISAFSYALAKGYKTYEATNLANKACGIVVSKLGTATITKNELLNIKTKLPKIFKYKDSLLKWVIDKKKKNLSIVFSNGCFDIIHSGHIDYLKKASNLADVFILGVNSDASINKLKGKGRPINKINERLSILKSLEFIDAIVVFKENTPIPILEIIKPNFLVKGGDYHKISDVVGHEIVQKHGGEIKIIPKSIEMSTTKILKKFK